MTGDKRGGGEATSQSNNVDSYKKFFQVFNGYSIVTDKFSENLFT